jgi:8-oxo-dGTP pyrophosphatase MutT (NUDIX family)
MGQKAKRSRADGRIWLAANGVVSNEAGEVLLILRRDTYTWAAPGGGVMPGERPDTAAVREIAEETGLKVAAVELTAVSFWRYDPVPFLSLYFSCRLNGGRLAADRREVRRARFFNRHRLPRPMIDIHRRPLLQHDAFARDGVTWQVVPLFWQHRLSIFGLHNMYRLRMAWRRFTNLLRRQPRKSRSSPPGTYWQHGAFVVIRDEAGAVLWVKRTDADVWNLPGGGAEGLEAPWETAVRETREETGLTVRLETLTGLYVYHDDAHLVCTFTATITGGALTTGPEAADFAWFLPGSEPENVFQQHVERAADACIGANSPIIRHQSAATILDDIRRKQESR